jgi:hypothetical protein
MLERAIALYLLGCGKIILVVSACPEIVISGYGSVHGVANERKLVIFIEFF